MFSNDNKDFGKLASLLCCPWQKFLIFGLANGHPTPHPTPDTRECLGKSPHPWVREKLVTFLFPIGNHKKGAKNGVWAASLLGPRVKEFQRRRQGVVKSPLQKIGVEHWNDSKKRQFNDIHLDIKKYRSYF